MRTTIVIVLCALAIPARADVTVYQNGDSYLDLQMLIQVQGRYVWGSGAGTTPDGADVFFAIPAIADENLTGRVRSFVTH